MKSLRSLLASALLLVAGTTLGQDHRLELGIEGGPSRVSLRGNQMYGEFNRADLGFVGGLSLQCNLTRHLSLRTNFQYNRKGASADLLFTDNTGATIADAKFHSKFDYLNVPVLLRLSFGDRFKFIANAGPFVGVLLKETDIADLHEDGHYAYDNTDQYEKLDYGLSAGVGLTRSIGKRLILSAEVRNDLGLSNVSATRLSGGGAIKTNSTQLLVGLAYAFGARSASAAP